MPSIADLYQLPFEIIWMLAIGYIGYRLTFVGRDAPHAILDRVFLIFVIGSVARWGATLIDRPWNMAPSLEAAVALIIGVSASLVWRRWGATWFYDAMYNAKLIDDDGQPDVWRSMTARKLRPPTRLCVKLTNGNWLLCNELSAFNDAPLGPCLFGADGSVAMYVTATTGPDDADWNEAKPFDPEYSSFGYEMTFIPAKSIERIEITRPS